MKLKNSTMLAGSQGPEMREQEEGAESTSADRETHGGGEKAFRDRWAGCVVKRMTTRYGNRRFKKGGRCKPVGARQTNALTQSRAQSQHRQGAWPRYLASIIYGVWGGALQRANGPRPAGLSKQAQHFAGDLVTHRFCFFKKFVQGKLLLMCT